MSLGTAWIDELSMHKLSLDIEIFELMHCISGGSKIETYFTKIVFYTVEYEICI